jgi:hypothetical protein
MKNKILFYTAKLIGFPSVSRRGMEFIWRDYCRQAAGKLLASSLEESAFAPIFQILIADIQLLLG